VEDTANLLVCQSTLASIRAGFEDDGSLIGCHWLLALNLAVKLNELAGGCLANQFDQLLAVIFRDLDDWL